MYCEDLDSEPCCMCEEQAATMEMDTVKVVLMHTKYDDDDDNDYQLNYYSKLLIIYIIV